MKNKNKYTSIGGQALIEGIMMKGPERTEIAVRMPNGEIDLSELKEKHLKDKCSLWRLPVFRGVAGLIESLATGYKALMISADKSGFAEEEDGEKMTEKQKTAFTAIAGTVGSVLGVVLAVVLFMLVPSYLFELTDKYLTLGFMSAHNLKPLFEGVIKIAVYVGYLAAVSLMKDIRRVFMYHGAEHKTIFCYEAGEELTAENAQKYRRFHPRCGTSFLFLMLAVSILVTSLLTLVLPDRVIHTQYLWVPIKILLVPLMCGLGYELIRFCGKHDNLATRIISAPGLWMQRLTTKEPTLDMLEVAVAALKAVIPSKGTDGAETGDAGTESAKASRESAELTGSVRSEELPSSAETDELLGSSIFKPMSENGEGETAAAETGCPSDE